MSCQRSEPHWSFVSQKQDSNLKGCAFFKNEEAITNNNQKNYDRPPWGKQVVGAKRA